MVKFVQNEIIERTGYPIIEELRKIKCQISWKSSDTSQIGNIKMYVLDYKGYLADEIMGTQPKGAYYESENMFTLLMDWSNHNEYTEIDINFLKLHPNYDRLILTLQIQDEKFYNNDKFMLEDAYIKFIDVESKEDIVTYKMKEIHKCGIFTDIIIGEFKRKGEEYWEFYPEFKSVRAQNDIIEAYCRYQEKKKIGFIIGARSKKVQGPMQIKDAKESLKKGEVLNLTALTGGVDKKIIFKMHCKTESDLNLFYIGLAVLDDKEEYIGGVSSQMMENFYGVNYYNNNENSPSKKMEVDFSNLPNCSKMVIMCSFSFMDETNLELSRYITDNVYFEFLKQEANSILIRYNMECNICVPNTLAIIGELTKKDGDWYFEIVSEGYDGGLIYAMDECVKAKKIAKCQTWPELFEKCKVMHYNLLK